MVRSGGQGLTELLPTLADWNARLAMIPECPDEVHSPKSPTPQLQLFNSRQR